MRPAVRKALPAARSRSRMRRTRPTLYEVDKRSAGLRTARGATMGSMSAPDSGRLPRLGDTFFDVRGGSRSMRVSWFADTGVAVFSIWQGGTCTGTFRLPIDDVSRLVDSLRRGVAEGPAAGGATGPMALGGQRPRLAIGAATTEPFTGMMAALTDDRAAAYGLGGGQAAGGFSAPAGGAGDQYDTAQQYGPGQQYAAGQYG